jgi:hypothetical protein
VNKLYRFIRRIEDVRLAWVALALHAGNNPVARANNVSAFQRFDPSMGVHGDATRLAGMSVINIWMAKVANVLVVAILKPSRRLNHYGFLPVLCHASYILHPFE